MKIYPITIPGGSDTYFQYNNGGIFGGSAHAVINDATGVSTFTGVTVTGNSVLGLNSAVFQPAAGGDSATFFQVKQADGTSFITGDSTNKKLAVVGSVEIYSTDVSDKIRIYHDSAYAYFRTSDGYFRFITDEGTDTSTILAVEGKGAAFGVIRAYDEDNAEYWQFYTTGGRGRMDVRGTSPVAVVIQYTGDVPIRCFESSPEGTTQSLEIYGFGTGFGGIESLDISVEQYAANTAHFAGLDIFEFRDGHLQTQNSTHENTDGGRESRWIGKGNKTDETEHTLGIAEWGHDGTGDDYKGYFKVGVNTSLSTADVITDALIIDSTLAVSTVKNKITPIGGIAVKLTNKTGANSIAGYCVTNSDSTADAVRLVPLDEPNCIGVFLDSGVGDGSEAWVVVAGIADVYFWDDTTLGHIARTGLIADTGEVSGQAMSEAVPTSPFSVDKHFCEIGHVLENRTGAGLARVVLHFN